MTLIDEKGWSKKDLAERKMGKKHPELSKNVRRQTKSNVKINCYNFQLRLGEELVVCTQRESDNSFKR